MNLNVAFSFFVLLFLLRFWPLNEGQILKMSGYDNHLRSSQVSSYRWNREDLLFKAPKLRSDLEKDNPSRTTPQDYFIDAVTWFYILGNVFWETLSAQKNFFFFFLLFSQKTAGQRL